MDLWKLLILGVVLVGLVLIFGSPPEAPKLPQGNRIEEGTFRITTPAGTKEEIFGIYPVDAGFRLVSIVHEGGKILLEADFLYAPDWTPLGGTLTQRKPEEARWIFAFSEGEMIVRKQVGARETLATLALEASSFPWDREIVASWYAPIRKAREGMTFWAVDVRTGEKAEVKVVKVEESRLLSLGRPLPAERLKLSLLEKEVTAFRQGELLLALKTPEIQAYLLEILPEGIREL
jgi:hypothetical protein